MDTRRRVSPWLGLGLLFFAANCGANDEFQQWMQQQSAGIAAQKKEFQEYKDKRDKEFIAFLKTHWKAVDIVKGEVRDTAPKPDVLPVAAVKPPALIVQKPDHQSPVSIVVPEAIVIEKPLLAPVIVPTEGNKTIIDFYGKPISFYYDARLKNGLNTRINAETISHYWSLLSRADYEDLMVQLSAQKKSLKLNDWAYASLIHKLAAKINNGSRNEGALLSWFLLVKSGYKARIAYNDTSAFLLVPAKQEMFEVSYFTYGGKRYYAVEFDGEQQRLGKVYTYDGEYPEALRIFDMQVTASVASSDQEERRHLSFNFEGKKYNIDVTFDRGRIKFLSNYPQLNLDLYFEAGVYHITATPLQQQLAAYMQGMSEQQAVNFLLRFVQTALQYETDEQQFGKENYLFPEETLFYPYSDCEDRAVLFAWLVKSLLNLDVVGLDYPGHVATAVHFNEIIPGDSISYQGKRYTVTDPTYINAVAGMSMPDFKQYTPTVIAY